MLVFCRELDAKWFSGTVESLGVGDWALIGMGWCTWLLLNTGYAMERSHTHS